MKNQRLMASLICIALAGTLTAGADSTRVVTGDDEDTFYVTVDQPAEPEKTVQPAPQPVAPAVQPVQANIRVVTAQDIEDNHYTSAAEAISHVNGVSVNEMASGTSSYIKLNGDDRVLILVDGQSLTNAQGSGYGRGNVDLESLPGVSAIDHIEVTKGSGSVAYGSGAVGGVINIVTKKGGEPKTTLDLRTGSWGTHHYGLTNSGSSGGTSWYITGNIDKRSYYKFDKGYNTDESRGDYNNKSLTARIDQKLDDKNSLTFQVFHKDSDGHGSTFKKKDGRFDLRQNKVVERLYNNYSVTWHFNEDSKTPGYVRYFNDYTRTYWTNHYHTRTQGLQAQNIWQTNWGRITAGAEWTEDEGTNVEAHYWDKKRTNRAAYLEDAIDFGKLTVTPGVRLDDNSTYGYHKTPRLALNYKANDKFNAYASWGRVFAPPRLNDQFYVTRSSRGNQDLDPETGYTQTLGFNYQYDAKTLFTVNFFRSHLNNVIRWNRSVTPHEAENLDEEKKRGFEVTMDKTINDKWSYDLGYSYIHTEIDKGQGLLFDTSFNRPNGYHAGLHYKDNRWKANLYLTAGTGRNSTYYMNNSYVVWDANVSYDVTKDFTLYAKVNNFADEGYDLYHEYPALGRYWQIGATYSF